LKKLMITSAAAAILAGSALAQAPTPAPTPSQMPAATAGKATVITDQKADQWLFSKFKGTDVIGSDNAKIGDVSDMLFDKDGKVLAYIVGVGGFLGIGSKDVAIAPASFQIQPATDRENMKLKLAMSKDELKTAAEFKPMPPPMRTMAPTTGQSPPRETPPTGR
jgi:hypothetical protein